MAQTRGLHAREGPCPPRTENEQRQKRGRLKSFFETYADISTTTKPPSETVIKDDELSAEEEDDDAPSSGRGSGFRLRSHESAMYPRGEVSRKRRHGEKLEREAKETISVSEAIISRLIGIKGKKIRELEDKTGATIDVIRETDPPKIRISGSRDAVADAAQMVYKLIHICEHVDENTMVETMWVPQLLVPRIMGVRGNRVMELQDQSGARIDVVKPQGDPTEIKVSGLSDRVVHAIEMISALIGDDMGTVPVVEEEEIRDLPRPLMKKVLDSERQLLNKLREQFKAWITIDAGASDDSITRIRVSGSAENVARAVAEIDQLTSRARGKKTVFEYEPHHNKGHVVSNKKSFVPSSFAPPSLEPVSLDHQSKNAPDVRVGLGPHGAPNPQCLPPPPPPPPPPRRAPRPSKAPEYGWAHD